MGKQYVHKEGPGSAPDADFEFDAFAVGVGVNVNADQVCEAVVLRQAVRIIGDDVFLVRSELPPAEARKIAEQLVLLAEKVEAGEKAPA